MPDSTIRSTSSTVSRYRRIAGSSALNIVTMVALRGGVGGRSASAAGPRSLHGVPGLRPWTTPVALRIRLLASTLVLACACTRAHADTATTAPAGTAAREATVLAAAPRLPAGAKPLPSSAAPDDAKITASGLAYVV